MRVFIIIVAFAGLALFGAAFVASYVNPGLVETLARDAIRFEVERRVSERIDALDGGKLVEMAKGLSGRNSLEIADLKRQLAEGLPQKVTAVAAQMRNMDCECRKAIGKSVTSIFERKTADLSRMNERLELLIRTKYMDVAESLTREFRIFTGANALVFLLLAFAASLRKRAGLQLALPTVVLLGPQHWLATCIFSIKTGCTPYSFQTMSALGISHIWRLPSRCSQTLFSTGRV